MSGSFEGVQIYAVLSDRDMAGYLERQANAGRAIDITASLEAHERAVARTLQQLYPGARVLVRRLDQDAPHPPRTRVDSRVEGVDTGEIEQEVLDLISEFDVTSCVVYRD